MNWPNMDAAFEEYEHMMRLAIEEAEAMEAMEAEAIKEAQIEERVIINTAGYVNGLADRIHSDNVAKGFYDDAPNRDDIAAWKNFVGMKIALSHSEISEGLEAFRKDKKDDHLPEVDGIAAEIADAVIRLLDLGNYLGHKMGDVIEQKLAYNRARPYKHGKQF